MSWRFRVVLPLSGLICLILLSAAAAAPTKDEIAQWIKQLGDGDFSTREKASGQLWQAGRAAEPSLEEALKNEDAEIVRRSREILERFRWGIYPDTPKRIVDLIGRYQGADAQGKQAVIRQLLDLGGQGCAILLKIAHVEDNEEVRSILFRQVAQEAPRAIPVMLADGNFTQLEQLLDLSLSHDLDSAIDNYAAYYLLKGKLDGRIAHFQAQVGKKPTPPPEEVLAHLYRIKGDLPTARRYAEKVGKKELIEGILWEQADWKELVKRGAGAPGEAAGALATLSFRAAYQRLSGDQEQFEKTIAEIRHHAETQPDSDSGEIWQCAKALFLNERPDDALALLRRGRDVAKGFEVLCAQLRYQEAFDLAARARKAEQSASPALLVSQARTLILLGERDNALQLFGKAAEEFKDRRDLSWYESLLEAETQLGLKDQALSHCARALGAEKEPSQATLLLEKVFPKKGEIALVWWDFLSKKFPDESGAARLKRLDTLLQGKVPLTDVEAWTREIEPKQGQAPSPRETRLWASAEAWLAAGQERQARECLERSAAASSSGEARLRLADFLAQRKDWTAAADWYGQAWEKDRTEPLALYLKGWALKQAGQAKDGQQLMDLAHWLPLGDEARRFNFADALSDRGHGEAARRERELLLHVHSLGSVYAGDILRRQAYEALAKKEYLKAAEYHERAMLRVLHPFISFVQTSAYVGVPEHVHRYRARGLLDAGKLAEARKEIDTALTLLPGNIELAILAVPVLEKQKHAKEADELFAKVFTPWEKVCKDYPQSAFAHNSAAWVAACCHRRLDEGLKHAQRAVELAPDNAGYIDTLAEVYFQRGDQKQAVELSKKCVALDPRREYFRKQVERHEAGDRSAELPDEGDND